MKIAQKLNPNSVTGTYLLGYIHISKWNFTLGVELLERANTISVNNPEIIRNLGWGLVMLGQTKKWITLLRRALNLAPNDELIIEDLWVALIGDGFVEEWSEYLRKVGKEYRIAELLSMMKLG
jgi:Flp pilus assembly protein TadD